MTTLPVTPLVPSRRIRNGMVMMVAAMLIVPGIDAIAKSLTGLVSPGQIALSRFLVQTLLVLPFVLGARSLRVGRSVWIHASRGVLMAAATVLFFTALRVLPLADAIAIFFIEPLLLTLLAAVFLGESIGWRRIVAALVGFAGALIIVRPSYQLFGLQALLPLGAALLFAVYLTLTRLLTRSADPVVMQFYAGVFGAVAMAAAIGLGVAGGIEWLGLVWPEPVHWLMLVGLGVVATAAHMLVVLALQRVPAAILAPFQYLEIISATILGLIIFGDFPDATTWFGIAVIVGSGLYVFHREQKLERGATLQASVRPRG